MRRVVAALLLLALTGIAHAATVSGTVTDTAGLPLLGMTVSAYKSTGILAANISTDISGRFALTLASGRYHLLAYDPAGIYATSFYADAESFETSLEIDLQNGQTLSNINFILLRGGAISGTVLSAGGQAISGITVAAYNLSGTRRGFTATDAAGRYRLVVPPGAYKLGAYDDAQRFATVFFDGATTFALAVAVSVRAAETRTGIGFVLPTAARIAGILSDSNGTPLAEMRAVAYDTNGYAIAIASSDSLGRYRLVVAGGSYRLVFDDPAGIYAPLFYPAAESFDSSPYLRVADAEQRNGIDASLLRAAHVAGRVTDASSGTPLDGLVVAAYNLDGTRRSFTATETSGEYSLVLPPGTFKFAAYDGALTYATQFFRGEVSFAAASAWSVLGDQTLVGFDFALQRAARVRGRVTDQLTGAALPRISVGAYTTGGLLAATTETDASGAYVIAIAPGTYKLTAFDMTLAYANGYADGAINFDLTKTISAAAGRAIDGQDFVLMRAARVSGSASDIANGEAIPGIAVTAFNANGFAILTASTANGGAFRMPLPPGTYRFVAADPLRRYTTLFYPASSTFEGAKRYTLAAGDALDPVAFRLTRLAIPRRHAAGR